MVRTRIFFTCDIHGSEVCFRKFVNAGKFYRVDILILGGDLTGKRIIPILEQPDGSYRATFLGKDYSVRSREELERLERLIRDSGCYPYRTHPDELAELSDESKLHRVFLQLIRESLERWISIAEERLKDTGIRCFIMPGNDDPPQVGEILEQSEFIINPEGKVVEVDPHHEMISLGYSNLTPWRCPRDIPENELKAKIEQLVSEVENLENCIFNLHCPPYDSGLDMAPALDENLRPIVKGGQIYYVAVGSTAVRESIETYQPLLGLHGHIHESRGVCRIGRTLCLNPGSEYTEGILRGAILNLDEKKVKGYALTSG